MKVARRVSFGVLVLLPLTISWAQDDQAGRREEGTRRQAAAAARDTTSDNASQQVISEFATMLAIKNSEEIELAKWAMEKTQNDDVRQFAQMLIDDHSKFLSQLQQFGPATEYTSFESGTTTERTTTDRNNTRRQERQENREERREERRDQGQAGQEQPGQDEDAEARVTRREGEEATTETQVTRRTTVAERGQGDSTIHLQVAQDSARRCLEMTKEKLGGKEGADFDRCFVGGAIVAHVGMIAKMQAQQQFASAEYSQTLDQGIQSAQKHLKHAESLAQKLEGSASGAKAGTTTRTREERPNPKEGADRNREDRTPDANPNP